MGPVEADLSSRTRGSDPGGGVLARLEGLTRSPLFAYGSVIAIQAKVLWGIWDHRDLSAGDSAFYYLDAIRWADGFELNPSFSPVYSAFWGSLDWLFEGAYAITIVHRLLIVGAATLLVLAVLRRLLSPGIAWLLAVWWAVLPVNYDTVYEVHLFALIPSLAAVLAALSLSGLRMRSVVFGILLATAVLVRNEVVVALLVWGIAWIGWEVWQRRRGAAGPSPRQLALATALPLAAVAALVGLVLASYGGSIGSIADAAEDKHKVNLCQIYAFGYEQRGGEFAGSAFSGCHRLMSSEFGSELPTMREAIAANTGAMAEHFLWNLRLVPSGLQLMLFDRISASERMNPDYIPVETGSSLVLLASLALLAFVIGGLALLWRDRRRWWEDWIRKRAWGWLALGALAAAAIAVMLMQRPRPSYLYGLNVGLLAMIGMCVMAVAARWPRLQRLGAVPPLLAIGILLAVPAHYDDRYRTPQTEGGRGLKEMVSRLGGFKSELTGAETRLFAPPPYNVGCLYLTAPDPCRGLVLEDAAASPVPPESWLREQQIDFVYLDEGSLAEPAAGRDLARLEAGGWRRLAPIPADEEGWVFLSRPPAPGAAP